MMCNAMRTAARDLGNAHALTLAATAAYGELLMETTGCSLQACDVLSLA
jgi:hypothetical protein